ncbi:MAG: mandelate racemase [Acidobacteria bacterium]|nr:mandelate racemase [Acidobacteriota bacterium]
MKITRIVDTVVPIRSEIRNAYISFSEMTASAVAVHTDAKCDGKPLVGYGFNSNGRYSQSGILRDRMIPRLMAADDVSLCDEAGMLDPSRCWRVMMSNEKPGGHGERSVAVGVLDMAIWDAVAKAEGKPLYRLLADRYNEGRYQEEVYVYAAGGYYYPGKEIEGLLEEMRRYLDLGYSTVKIKIGGAPLHEDQRRIEAVLRILGPGQDLAVDANGRFDHATALEYAEALNDYSLKWYEEPCEPLDYEIHADVAQASRNPIATGENIFSVPDALNLIRYARLVPERDFLQFDPALSYGVVEYLRILEMLRAHGWSPRRCIPHGGHQMALHVASGLGLHGNESYPGVFQPFGGFADGMPVHNSRVRLPDAPGIGIEQKQNLYEVFREL